MTRTHTRTRTWLHALRKNFGRQPFGRKKFRPFLEGLETRLAPANVTTWHNDTFLSGLNNNETILTPANVNSTNFGKLFSYGVDGYVYAQPLYVSNLNIAGGTHNVVFVATEHDSVYAFDADSKTAGPSGNGLYWQTSLLVPRTGFTVTTVPSGDTGSGDIVPEVGITGTPVIDAASNTLYVLAKTKEVEDATGTPHYIQRLYALDIRTGSVLRSVTVGDTVNTGDNLISENNTDIRVTGANTGRPGDTTPPSGPGTENGEFRFNARRALHRGALTLAGNGTLYMDFASHGDNGNYRGWVIGYDPQTFQLRQTFLTNLDARASGIWQSGAPVAIDANNDLYFATGNAFGVSASQIGSRNLSESVVRIGPNASGQLVYKDSFTPFNWAQLDAGDTDLGSGGTLLLPDAVGSAQHRHLIVETGKQGRIYLLDRGDLGGLSPNQAAENARIVDVLDQGVAGVWGSPTFLQDGSDTGLLFYHGSGDYLKAFRITNGHFVRGTREGGAVDRTNNFWGFPGSQPSISANNGSNALVWELQANNFSAQGPEVLHVYDAHNLGNELYRSDAGGIGQRDRMGGSVKFVVPTVANGHVYAGTETTLDVFGLFPVATQVPDVPTNLSAVGVSPTQITLTWDPRPLEGPGAVRQIDVERSLDGSSFTQVQIVSRDATSYTDSGLAPATHYFYRIRAENNVGASGYSNVADALTLLSPTRASVLNILNTQVDLVWSLVPEADVGYDIQRSANAGQTWKTVGSVGPNVSSFSDTGLSHQTYQYRVIARASSGQSSVSNVVTADLTTGSSGVDYGGGFNDVSGLTFNGVARRVEPGWLQLTDGNNSEAGSAFTNSRLGISTFHTTFTYRMHDGTDPRADGMTFIIQGNSPSAIGPGGGGLAYGADNPAGAGGILNSVAIKFDLYNNVDEGTNSTGLFTGGRSPTVRAPGLPPSIPDTSVNLSAAPYLDASGNPIININDQHLKRVDLDYDGTTLVETITDLQANPLPDGSQPSVTIRYTVDIPAFVGSNTAYVGFGGGTGGLNVVQEVRTWTYTGTADRPPAPYSLFADPYSNPGSVNLTWFELSPTETGFQLERAQADANGNLGPWTRLNGGADLAFNVTTYTDTPPQPGTYFYRVRAFNEQGQFSNYATSGPVAVLVPEAPSYLWGRPAGSNEIDLQWTNNSFTQTGFRVERSVGDLSHFVTVGTTDASTTSFRDTTVHAPNTYNYRVVATNSYGDSLPSNVASITLQLSIQPVLYYRFDETAARTAVDFGNGFANSTNLTANTNNAVNVFPGTPPVMRLTDSRNGEATSVFYNTRVGTGAFSTTFTLQDHPGAGAADSLSFVIQNDPRGTGALGNGGGDGGYGGISNSIAIKFDLYSGGTHTPTTGLYTNGQSPGGAPGGQSIAMTGIDLGGGHPMQVTLNYDGTNLVETVGDTVTNATFTHVYTLNLAQVIGGSSAYVGFTAGTGGENATQDILSWAGSFLTSSGLGSASDSSGNGNTGTLFNGVTHVDSLPGLGKALRFDGTGYVMANDSPSLDPQFQITVSAFINADDWNGNRRLVQKGNNDNQYRLLAEGGHLVWEIAGVGRLDQAALPSTGAWHNVTGTYDGTTMTLYVDGAVVQQAGATGSIHVTADPLFVGTKNAGAPAGDHFKGLIDEVRIYARALSQAEIRLLPLTDTDVGSVAAAGSANINFSTGVVTVSGSGDDIWNHADAFNFAYQPLQGDGQITARVTNVQNTDYWAKGAVMFRESLDANSKFVDLVTTPSPSHSEDSLQWRETTGGGPHAIDQGPGSAPLPYWIRLTRRGNTFTGEKSADGVHWVTVGTAVVNMTTDIFVGLAVTAHNNDGRINTSTFDNVSIVTNPGQVVYQLDDATSQENFNNSQGTETEDNWVANSFQATSGGETLRAVQFKLGQTYTNRAITVLIYRGSSLTDPQAGGGLGAPVSTTNTTFSGPSGSLVTIPLASPLTLAPGQVYWAALLMRGVPGNEFPFATDTHDPVLGRSWFDVGPTQGGAYNVNNTGNARVFGATNHPVVPGGVQSAGNLVLRVIDDPTDGAGSAGVTGSAAGSSGASPAPGIASNATAAALTTETTSSPALPGAFSVTAGVAPPTSGADRLPSLLGGLNALAGAGLGALLSAPASLGLNTDGQPAGSPEARPILPSSASLADEGVFSADTLAKELAGARLGAGQQDADPDAVDEVFAQYPFDDSSA